VILPGDFPREVLGDSKKLSPRRREAAAQLIYSHALAWGAGWASVAEIDEINILRASLLAMSRAFAELCRLFPLPTATVEAVADGRFVPDLPVPCRAVIRADASIPEVMAASILAKTARDRVMDHYARLYPEYGYDRHKGYPTREHRAQIARHGPSPIQRKSFRVSPPPGV
jgi:ribonuclease HII